VQFRCGSIRYDPSSVTTAAIRPESSPGRVPLALCIALAPSIVGQRAARSRSVSCHRRRRVPALRAAAVRYRRRRSVDPHDHQEGNPFRTTIYHRVCGRFSQQLLIRDRNERNGARTGSKSIGRGVIVSKSPSFQSLPSVVDLSQGGRIRTLRHRIAAVPSTSDARELHRMTRTPNAAPVQ